MPEKVGPPNGGTEGVSPDTAPKQIAAAPLESVPNSVPKRGRKLIGEARLTGAQRQARHQQKVREKRNAESVKHDSKLGPTKAEAKRLLELRGLINPHVIERVYELLDRAADELGLPRNRFLYSHGVIQTLKSYEAKEALPLPEIADEQVIGELLNRAELYALYDSSIAWREELSFEDFLSARRDGKTDCFLLGLEILGKDLAECHKTWSDFFPRFNPDTLPPNYTQKQAIKWLSEQSELKNFLLLASRSAFKSSWSHIWLLSLILCFPDVRVLLVSETRPLAKDFIGVIRSYFEAVPGHETRFNQLYPEFTIAMDDGSALSLDCPMAHLRLPQSIESVGMDVAIAGRRFDVGLFDDCISSTSCGNDVQIEASHKKFLALLKLRETSGLVLVLGTPWAENDLYFRLIKQAKENQDSSWTYRIDPAFVVKREANHKLTSALLPTLVESDIESFLFPERLNWKFLKQEISNSPSFFLSQNLCIFPRDSNANLRVTFEEKDLRARVRPIGSFERTAFSKNVAALDRAYSISKYADFSSLCVARTLVRDNRPIMAVLDCPMDRLKESELIEWCVRHIIKYEIELFILEKDKGYETLILSIQRQLNLRGIPSPHFKAVTIPSGGHNVGSKVKRVKVLEAPLTDGRLWFASGEFIEGLFPQFIKYDGIHDSNSHRKDDGPDSVALAYENCMPKDTREIPDAVIDAKAKAEAEEKEQLERQAEQRRAMHAAMFSEPSQPPPPRLPDPEPEQTQAQKNRSMLSKILPTGMRY